MVVRVKGFWQCAGLSWRVTTKPCRHEWTEVWGEKLEIVPCPKCGTPAQRRKFEKVKAERDATD